MIDILASCMYITAFISLNVALFLYKKSDEKKNLVISLVVNFMTILCIQAFCASILSLVRINVSIFTIGIVDLAFSTFFIYRTIKSKERQKYYIEWQDILAVSIFTIVSLAFFLFRFTTHLYICYETSDPAIHLQNAMIVVNEGKVAGMLFTPFTNGMFLSTFQNFFGIENMQHLYVFLELPIFLLAGLTFYAVVRSFVTDRRRLYIPIIVTLLYMIGYPLNNMIFGFSYLGVGVYITCFYIYCIDEFINKKSNGWFGILLMVTSGFCVVTSYVLFAPFVLVSSFITVSYVLYKDKKLFKLKTVELYIVIYFIPCIVGAKYIYEWLFLGNGVGMDAIQYEGYVYRNLFSNFIIYFPIALYGVYRLLKNKAKSSLQIVFSVFLFSIVSMLLLGLRGKMSSYYYYKMYYDMWLICLLAFSIGLDYLAKKTWSMANIVLLCIAGLFCISHFDVEERIKEESVVFNNTCGIDYLFDVSSFNNAIMHKDDRFYNQDAVKLYEWALEKNEKGKMTYAICYWLDFYWFEALSNRMIEEYFPWSYTQEGLIEVLESKFDYIVFLYDNDEYQDVVKYFSGYERVFENGAGYIVKVR